LLAGGRYMRFFAGGRKFSARKGSGWPAHEEGQGRSSLFENEEAKKLHDLVTVGVRHW